MGEPWHEFVVEGPRRRGLAFLQGFVSGRGLEPPVNAEEESFEVGNWMDRIREALSSNETYHLLVAESARDAFRDGTERARDLGLSVEIVDERVVRSAEFDFRLHVFSREHARKIREMLAGLPDGASLSDDTTLQESVDPEARGSEAYAPIHGFELSGKGTVRGDIGAVLEAHRCCREEPLIERERIRLRP